MNPYFEASRGEYLFALANDAAERLNDLSPVEWQVAAVHHEPGAAGRQEQDWRMLALRGMLQVRSRVPFPETVARGSEGLLLLSLQGKATPVPQVSKEQGRADTSSMRIPIRGREEQELRLISSARCPAGNSRGNSAVYLARGLQLRDLYRLLCLMVLRKFSSLAWSEAYDRYARVLSDDVVICL